MTVLMVTRFVEPEQAIMRFKRRTLLQVALSAPAIIAGAASFGQSKKTIRSVPIGDLKVLDPIWSTAYITRNHAYMVWDTLFALDSHNQPRPQMVDTYTISDDKLTYTFTLRRGLLWHDGAPFRAADCVASIRRWAAKDGMGRALMAVSSDLKALDETTFRLVLHRPVGFVLDALGKNSKFHAGNNQSISQLRETSRQRLAVATEVVKLTNSMGRRKRYRPARTIGCRSATSASEGCDADSVGPVLNSDRVS